MTAFPAAFNTWLIDVEPTIAPLPLVGWVHTTGLNVSPLVIGHPGPLVTGEAFLLQNGQVYDPAISVLYDDEDSWRDTVSENSLYRPGQPIALMAGPATPAATPASTPAAPVRLPSVVRAPIEPGALIWGTKEYKSKSFWSFAESDGSEVIFLVEGGKPFPTNATKITREEFYAKRKAGVEERAGSPDDEPELPMGDDSDGDDDDDDMI